MSFWRNYKAAGTVEGNMKGDGYHLGGLLLIGKENAGVQWIFKEENFGNRPSKDQIVEAINALVPMEPKNLPAPQAAPVAATTNTTQAVAKPAESSAEKPAGKAAQ